ncbi:MAG: quinoprotein relay system zinc metallohydrolase 1 [Alphaproteobacteria bacterium]|nr:quinoprotein relay system zinc metallohydrolase 1 [Alphaproteobacteria bacterium]
MTSYKQILVGAFLVLSLALISVPSNASKLVYNLKPQLIADGVYLLEGSTDHFNRKNGGNIVNTGFLVGSDGVVVIDTGPSLRYGSEMRAAIKAVTPKPIKSIIITHDHPDHYLGNQAFKDIPIMALPETIAVIKRDGDEVAEGMYRMVGDWMRGTEVVVPNQKAKNGEIVIGGRAISLIALDGHTSGDLVVFDKKSGVIFAGDLAFHKRTPTFPSATLNKWVKSLIKLKNIPFKIMVPGHGPVVTDSRAIDSTIDYIKWIDATLRAGVDSGADMNEMMATDIPAPYNQWGVSRDEFIRSITYLFPKMEAELLPRIDN